MTVVTRFAPSPTGFLHIGGARTALFNWLYARGHEGRFLLRVEDTDRARSTPEATRAILDGLAWLELAWDGEPIFQSSRSDRHREIADTLLRTGHAYRCYCTPEELAAMREQATAEKRAMWYDGRWRDRDPAEAPAGIAPTVRIRTPVTGDTVIADSVQGTVTVANQEIDDFVILRADGTPTYMLSVVVDDHDMEVTHVIRGDDHFTNAFRQCQIYDLLGWARPTFAHIPLIHGPDGKKLSKRHGALGIDHYREAGYLPAALRKYLLRLGWARGDEEVIRTASTSVENGLLGQWNATNLKGKCTLRLTARDKAGLESSVEINVTLDASEVAARINSPRAGEFVEENVQITGTAKDENFSHFELSYRPSDAQSRSPKGEISVVDSGQPKNDEPLAVWETPKLDEAYELQILAFDLAGKQSMHSVPVLIDNLEPSAEIISPDDGNLLSGTVDIVGTADDAYFQDYQLEFRPASHSDGWTPILAFPSTQQKRSDILASWVTPPAVEDYDIRRIVTDRTE